MALKIQEILLQSNDFENYRNINETPIQKLNDVSKINIFIGENNSGKSRFLRELFKTNFNYIPDGNIQLLEYLQEFKKFISAYIGPGRSMTIQFDSPIGNRQAVTPNEVVFIIDEILNKAQPLNINAAETKEPIYVTSLKIIEQVSRSMGYHRIKDLLDIPLVQYSIKEKQNFKFSALYIPVLRGLRPVARENYDYYIDRTIKDYFTIKHSGGGTSPEIEQNKVFTGLNLYEEIKNHLLGSKDKRELVKDFENFLRDNFFNGADVELIPRIDNGNDVVHVKIGNEEERAIYNLGDGIQQIIILTFQMFMNKDKNMLFFIEEPELYLHPGMQRIFLDTITTHEGFENFQYFIATHSNHFLDITLDTNKISVYTFKKTKKIDEKGHPFFSVENVNNDDISTLELIGVRNSSVFLSNCTVWVEGITDRMYLRKYLELYQKANSGKKQFKEDLHYSFVEYGGGNITHWSFLGEQDNQDIPTIDYKKITNKIFLVSDKDTGKEERHEELRNHLGDAKDDEGGRYYCLDCREIENLLMPHVLQKVIGIYEKNKGNTADIPLFNYDEYKNKYLGNFIDDKFTNKKIKSYKDGSSDTIANKTKFAKRAIESLHDYSDLSEEAQALTKKIYDFIGSHNNT